MSLAGLASRVQSGVAPLAAAQWRNRHVALYGIPQMREASVDLH